MKQRGFTLLEVLVALAVVALALGALVRAGSSELRAQARLDEVQRGQLAAQTLLAELRLGEPFPAEGLREGRLEQGGLKLRYRITIGPTPDRSIRRAEVQLFRDQETPAPVASITGFLSVGPQ
ncbi:MAG: type II secretion system minor pseudopilin GspI [Xanthomonadales bacterium]|jgi:general secretion pathway protein I|nr:type II secretion system minor pseudopilin GspI [Xanthomonadales bacterium]